MFSQKGIHSKFRQEVYDAVDQPSKDAVIAYLQRWGYETCDEEQKGVDIIARKDGIISWHECENRQIFEDHWPFRTIHIPERKGRYGNPEWSHLGSGYFWIINKYFTMAFVIKYNVAVRFPKVEVPNTREAEGEFFYDVPLANAHLRFL